MHPPVFAPCRGAAVNAAIEARAGGGVDCGGQTSVCCIDLACTVPLLTGICNGDAYSCDSDVEQVRASLLLSSL